MKDFLIIAFNMSPFGPVRSLISRLVSSKISEKSVPKIRSMYRTIRSRTENPYQLEIFGTVMPFMNNVIKASHRIDYREPNMSEIAVIKRFVNEEQKYLKYLE